MTESEKADAAQAARGEFAILFPGQGAQRVGMGQDLAAAYPEARAVFARANAAVGFDLARLCFEGPADELNRTSLCQPAILATSVAALEAWKAHGGDGAAVAAAGLSLGEYTALCYAGSLTFEDAVRLVYHRGQFMEDAGRENPGGMVTLLGMERDRLSDALDGANEYGIAEVANLNCPGQIVVAGTNGALDWLANRAKDFGAQRAIRLKVSGAFHSRLMAPASDRLGRLLHEIAISQPHVAVVSNVTAKPIRDAAEIRDLLIRQLTSPVLWEDSMRFLLAQGVRRFVEVGPGKVLTGLLGRIEPAAAGANIEGAASVAQAEAGTA